MQVTRARSPDGTVVELFSFDFKSNPRLRLALHDSIEEGSTSASLTTVDQLTERLRGALLAWNGPFFAYDSKDRSLGHAIAPAVTSGSVRHNVGNHRWFFGARSGELVLLHMPTRAQIDAARVEFGAGGLQCLIREGKPLRIEPFPETEDAIKTGPVPSSIDEAGHIPIVDHIRTSRT
jgi:hypothetical protein